MTLGVEWTTQFKKDYKKAMKQGKNMDLIDDIIRMLSRCEKLSEKNEDHELTGNWLGHRECHISPDWLLIYRVNLNVLTLSRTDSHSELLDK